MRPAVKGRSNTSRHLARQRLQPPDRPHCLVHGAHDEAALAVLHDLFHRAARESNHGCAAGHAFDHHQAKRFRPINGEEEPVGVGQEFVLIWAADFPDELDQ